MTSSGVLVAVGSSGGSVPDRSARENRSLRSFDIQGRCARDRAVRRVRGGVPALAEPLPMVACGAVTQAVRHIRTPRPRTINFEGTRPVRIRHFGDSDFHASFRADRRARFRHSVRSESHTTDWQATRPSACKRVRCSPFKARLAGDSRRADFLNLTKVHSPDGLTNPTAWT
jgi:hypothetical protein